MFIEDLGNVTFEFNNMNASTLMDLFRHSSDETLVMECELLGECYRSWNDFSLCESADTPLFIAFLDDYQRCLYPVVVQRFIDMVLARCDRASSEAEV